MKALPFTEAIRKAKLEVLQGQGEAQTRRMEPGLREINREPEAWRLVASYEGEYHFWHPDQGVRVVKPRHHEGEIAYVPEAWCIGSYERWRYVEVVFKAGGAIRVDWNSWMEDNTSYARSNVIEEKWRSSRFMPAWAARWFVQIVGVLPQRVQEITEAEAMAEGAESISLGGYGFNLVSSYRQGFEQMWDAAYPKYPFKSNPWEMTYRFRLVPRPEGL